MDILHSMNVSFILQKTLWLIESLYDEAAASNLYFKQSADNSLVSSPFFNLFLTLRVSFFLQTDIGPKYQSTVSLISNNQYQPWRNHMNQPLVNKKLFDSNRLYKKEL